MGGYFGAIKEDNHKNVVVVGEKENKAEIALEIKYNFGKKEFVFTQELGAYNKRLTKEQERAVKVKKS